MRYIFFISRFTVAQGTLMAVQFGTVRKEAGMTVAKMTSERRFLPGSTPLTWLSHNGRV
jgi:hypothetical protein